jgi:hypothetical protein
LPLLQKTGSFAFAAQSQGIDFEFSEILSQQLEARQHREHKLRAFMTDPISEAESL